MADYVYTSVAQALEDAKPIIEPLRALLALYDYASKSVDLDAIVGQLQAMQAAIEAANEQAAINLANAQKAEQVLLDAAREKITADVLDQLRADVKAALAVSVKV